MLKICFLLVLLVLGACSSNPMQHANQIAQTAGLTQQRIDAGQFQLATYSKILNKNKSLNIYIEGDGRAWLSKNQASTDPTPHTALGLQLASVDAAENVVYIARPCQFYVQNCNQAYWTNKRFSEEVVASINAAIDVFVRKTNQQAVHLIGYSGGAAIAVLVAARRTDIASIRTVAGNLDHAAVNAYHGVSAMPASLNPIDFAPKISKIPQLHFVGAEDARVPAQIAQNFLNNQHSGCARIVNVLAANHEDGWLKQWPALLQQKPSCEDAKTK